MKEKVLLGVLILAILGIYVLVVGAGCYFFGWEF
jgi:hypothetical protein